MKWIAIMFLSMAALLAIALAFAERKEVYRINVGLTLTVDWIDALCDEVKERHIELVKHNKFKCDGEYKCPGFITSYIAECKNGTQYGIPIQFGGKMGSVGFSYFDSYPENIGVIEKETSYTDAYAVAKLLEEKKKSEKTNKKK